MKAFIPAIAATFCLTMSPGFAADTSVSRDFITLAEYQGTYPLNRLDLDDLQRERAREAEHRRIRTRLGDPGRGCRTVAVGGQEDERAPSPGLLVIVCR
jgi:hypothetical protein